MKDIPFRQKIRAFTTTIFLVLFPVIFYYLSPVIPIGGSAEGIITGSLIIFAILFLVSIFLGRGFCAYICPAGTLQDYLSRARTKSFSGRILGWIKYLIWASWLLMLFFFFRRAGGIQGIDFTYQTVNGISVSDTYSMIIYLIVLAVFIVLSLVLGRRAACHTICWMAPFMVIGRKLGLALKLPSLRVVSRSDKCTDCGRCTSVCLMSLDVKKLQHSGAVLSRDCILCGECIDSCPRNVLSFSWK